MFVIHPNPGYAAETSRIYADHN